MHTDIFEASFFCALLLKYLDILLFYCGYEFMSSPGQKRGACGHVMAIFDSHSVCARCRDKGKGKDPCVENPQCTDCKLCNLLTPDLNTQLATPSYKLKKEKREARKLETDSSSTTTTPVKDCVLHPIPPLWTLFSAFNRGCGWPQDAAVPWSW